MYKVILLGLAAAIALPGCIIHVTDDGWESGSYSSWEQREKNNREAIAEMEIGTGIGSVEMELGRADFSEAYLKDGSEYRVLFYRTHRVDSDGETTRAETTPLVFENGYLIGWGDTVYQRVAQQ